MVKNELAFKKAELISNNNIFISKDIKLDYPLSKSVSGPSSGSLSIGFSFNNRNIKMNVSKSKNECFSLVKENGSYCIERYGENFLEGVSILPIFFHAPYQIFMNIDNRCIFNCSFCHLSKKRYPGNFNENRYVETILKASNLPNVDAVVLTSGVFPNIPKIVERICLMVKKIRRKMPSTSFGVETCIDNKSELLMLKNAGIDELKLNLQIPDEALFEKICPDFEYEKIFKLLKEAVDIFGKGRVTSNIIYGLGESFESIVKTVENLAKLGVVPTLRALRTTEYNKKKIKQSISFEPKNVDPARIVKVASEHRKILEKHNLTTKTFNTMCHKCGCCDLVPFWDI